MMLIILIIPFIVIIVYFKKAWLYWKNRGVEVVPVKFPFGNAQNIILQKNSLGEEVQKAYTIYKKEKLHYGGFYFITRPIFILVDLNLIKNVLVKDFQFFSDRFMYVNEEIDPLSGHLFSLKGKTWKSIRMKLTPTFTSEKMKIMFDIFFKCSNSLVGVMDEHVENTKVVDIKEIIARFTTDIIACCAFGVDCDSLWDANSEFRKYGMKAFRKGIFQIIKDLIWNSCPKVAHLLNFRLFPKDVCEFFVHMVEETIRYRESNHTSRKDLMQLLMQIKNDSSNSVTVKELAAQAFGFFIAGFETSTNALNFLFYEIVNNNSIQNSLRTEINDVLQRHGSNVTYNAIKEMTYMDKCIFETLRKYPPFPLLIRECSQTYRIPETNLTIEKGTNIFIPLLGIHYDCNYYPNPTKFDPERFSDVKKSERNPFSWLPFGEGPRNCIGMRFGLLQTKIALAVLLKNYEFSCNENTNLPLGFSPKGFMLRSKNRLWLNVEKI
ncbi:hypothetical protein RI129_013225 [Pyrocoelia pectoralis]|uniref:Cytochrome P450 n=1 Tax=Pyrocoelia pectoralis TaxID=417401 RepID=A0AAN7Z7J6_9COLE